MPSATGPVAHPDVEVLLPEAQIRARIAELGQAIAVAHAGRKLIVVGVLRGSFMFLADLVRAIPHPDLEVEFLAASSYQGTNSTGEVRITQDLSRPIEGEDVLLVEDIVDTGLTVHAILDHLRVRRPRSLELCALLHKPARSRVAIRIDYNGFTIEDRFVVGYGLDVDGRLRQLPFVGVYKGSS